MDKKTWMEAAKKVADQLDNDMCRTAAKNLQVGTDYWGMQFPETKLLGTDAKLDGLIKEMHAELGSFYEKRIAIGQYLKSRLEPKK